MPIPVVVGLSAVIVAVTDEVPRILTVTPPVAAAARPGSGLGGQARGSPLDGSSPSPLDALAWGPLDPERDRTLGLGLRRWVSEQTGLELGYLEQLYTFGDRDRDRTAGARVLVVAYLALVREGTPVGGGDVHWRDVYAYFPWEDRRAGRPEVLDRWITPALADWVRAAPDVATSRARQERADITFGLSGAPWDGDRVLERYELLYEAGLVPEAIRDRGHRDGREAGGGAGLAADGPAALTGPSPLGRPMAQDHRRIVATALGRLRGKLKYRPVVFELLPPAFTLLQLQRLVEALAGTRLHKQNFRRLVEHQGLVEGTGALGARTSGRPAELFRFRSEVLRERSTPGIGLPSSAPPPGRS
jgi:hypothetical protein